MVDGGTLNRKRHFNTSIGSDGKTYFWKSCRVENLTACSVLKELQILIENLAKEEIYVFCIVADNASAFQKAAGIFSVYVRFWTFCIGLFEKLGKQHCGEEVDSEDESDDHEVENEEVLPVEMEEALENMQSKGIFAVRCTAHSLQVQIPL